MTTLAPANLNAQLKWLDAHIAIQRNTLAGRVARKCMHQHTMDEVLGNLQRVRASLEAARNLMQAQAGVMSPERLDAIAEARAHRRSFAEHVGGGR